MSKATPKLKDVLEVFMEELEELKKGLRLFQKTLLEHKIEPNVAPLNQWAARFLDLFQQSIEKENGLFQERLQRAEELIRNANRKMYHFYMYTAISFLIAIGSTLYSANLHVELTQVKKEKQEEARKAKIEKQFIEETGAMEEFKDWFENQQ